MGEHQIARKAAVLAAKLDPSSVAESRRRAKRERRVTVRPAPDGMAYVTALVPMTQGVAIYAVLTKHADRLRATGDPRGRGQIMADTLVERITGQTTADAVPVRVNLTLPVTSLLGGGAGVGHLDGYGPIDAAAARDTVLAALATSTDDEKTRLWVRRVFTDPVAGDLVGLESTSRTAPAGLADLVRIRDGGTCRTPYCDAPVRHIDHIRDHNRGGPTSAENLQATCVGCNHAKQALGWQAEVVHRPDGRHRVITTTPTGHSYESTAPEIDDPDTRAAGQPEAAPITSPRVDLSFATFAVDLAA